MNVKIETLQNEKKELENKIRQYNRTINDLSFRHFTKNLSMHVLFENTSFIDR